MANIYICPLIIALKYGLAHASLPPGKIREIGRQAEIGLCRKCPFPECITHHPNKTEAILSMVMEQEVVVQCPRCSKITSLWLQNGVLERQFKVEFKGKHRSFESVGEWVQVDQSFYHRCNGYQDAVKCTLISKRQPTRV